MPFYYAGLVTALAEMFSGSIVLPSLARKDLRMTSSHLIRVRLLQMKWVRANASITFAGSMDIRSHAMYI